MSKATEAIAATPPARARRGRLRLGAPALIGLCLLLLGCASSTARPDPPPHSQARPASREPFRFFAPSSFWNTPLSPSAPLDPESGRLIGALDAEVASEQALKSGPWINTTSYSVPIYRAGPRQRTVGVRPLGRVPAALRAAWRAVPIPAGAVPASGTDAQLVIWQPSSDRLWEFWRLAHGPSGWQATWGGAMRHASADSGVYGPAAWPGAQSSWGASASSLSIAGGLITLEDLRRGEINHALSIALPETRQGVFASPAKRTDGTSQSPLSLPEGAHLRLDPTLNLTTLHLPRLTRMIAEAAQRYGIFVRDRTANIAFYGQDPITAQGNPYAGPRGYFEGRYPTQLLASFPWSHLQLLRMALHGPGSKDPGG